MSSLLRSRSMLSGLLCVLCSTFGVNPAYSQVDSASYNDNLIRASSLQANQNRADEAEQKRLSSSFALVRRDMQVRAELEHRQMRIDFSEKRLILKEDQTRRESELRAELDGDELKLNNSVDNLKAALDASEACSRSTFDHHREAFSLKLQADLAEQLAKAEAYRESRKQIAIAAAMAYFTGGTSLAAMGPALAGGGDAERASQPNNASPAVSSSPTTAVPIGAPSLKAKTQPSSGIGASKPMLTARISEAPNVAESGVKVYEAPAGPPIRTSTRAADPLFGPHGLIDLSTKEVDARGANGCTLSPDRILWWNTKPACDQHDICYSAGSNVPRVECDLIMFNDMLIRGVPVPIATPYLFGVDSFGGKYYKGNKAGQ